MPDDLGDYASLPTAEHADLALGDYASIPKIGGSPTPETDKAVAGTAIAASRMPAAGLLEEIAKPARAIAQTGKDLVLGIPQALWQTGKFAADPVKTTMEALPGVVGQMQQARQSPPLSQEWWNAVTPLAAQEAMAVAGVRGSAPKVLKQEGEPVLKAGEAPVASELPKTEGGDFSEEVQKGGMEAQGPAQGETIVEPAAVSGTESPPAAEPPSPTSIKNAIVDQERVTRGLQPAMEPAKRSFGTVWDEASKAVDENPTVREDLIDELKSKPRALTDKEDALLLHKQIELQNDFDKTSENLIKAQESNDPAATAEHRVRFAQLSDQLLDVYDVNKTAGTETARGLAARKMLANEDFSLAKMVTRKRAANEGRQLSPEQVSETGKVNAQIVDAQSALDAHMVKQEARLKAFKTRTKGAIGKVEEKLRTGDFTKQERVPLQLDQEGFKLKGNLERLKQKFQEGLIKDMQRKRTLPEKVGDTLVKWRRGFILSSPITLGKLTSAAAQRMVFTPIEEGVGGAIGKVFPKLAEKATIEGGFSARAEGKALTEGLTKGMSDAWDVLRTGKSELDVNFQKKTGLPRSAIDFIGQVHGALKTVPKRAAFARAMEKQFQRGIASGVDVTDPMVQSSYMIKAYQEANKSIFMQDNAVVSAWKRGMSAFEQPDKATGHVPLWKKSVATTGKVLLPIVKIPTNIVAETMQYATGTVTGGARLARAYARGIETLRPEEADLIMRQLKKGSAGGAVMLLGFLNPDVVGGYYQPGKKRAPGDVKAGSIRVYGHDIPSWALHNPLLETLQIGSTIRRVAVDKMGSIPLGLAAGALGLIEEVPFVREMLEVSKAFRANERVAFAGELSKSLVVPQAVQWAAQHFDPTTEYRKPRTVMEHIATGIPGLRETVPVKSGGNASKPFGTKLGSRWPAKKAF